MWWPVIECRRTCKELERYFASTLLKVSGIETQGRPGVGCAIAKSVKGSRTSESQKSVRSAESSEDCLIADGGSGAPTLVCQPVPFC